MLGSNGITRSGLRHRNVVETNGANGNFRGCVRHDEVGENEVARTVSHHFYLDFLFALIGLRIVDSHREVLRIFLHFLRSFGEGEYRIANRYLNHHAEGCEVNVNLGRELIFSHQTLEVDGYFTEHGTHPVTRLCAFFVTRQDGNVLLRSNGVTTIERLYCHIFETNGADGNFRGFVRHDEVGENEGAGTVGVAFYLNVLLSLFGFITVNRNGKVFRVGLCYGNHGHEAERERK